MNLFKAANTFEKLARDPMAEEEYQLLLKIDNSPFHFLPADELKFEEKEVAFDLWGNGWITLLPTNLTYNFPRRYVLTAAGHYALGTFDFNTLKKELAGRKRSKPI